MTRAIKFRAWDIKKNDWAYIDIDDWDNSIGPTATLIPKQKKVPVMLLELISDTFYIWMQFTGLKDKNGKEIFEGDVASVDMFVGYTGGGKEQFEKENGVVVYYDNGFYIQNKDGHTISSPSDDNIEIIGNICESPELLKN